MKYIHYNVCDEITYPFPILKCGNGQLIHPTPYNGCNYLYMLELELIHAGKIVSRSPFY